MARALALAERGRGRTSPNPMVGAVIVDDEGIVVGRGAHAVAGGPHAEVFALDEAGARASGATLYCTLEPCSHTGRTGPCAPLVVAAGIRRAVVAVEDPNPAVSGRGLALLRERGIDVTVGVLREEATRLNEAFFTRMHFDRPFVAIKVALSLDGCVAAARGARTPLTCPAANRLIHRERAEVDALAVGSGTVLIDDPLLTPRGAYRVRPLVRVILDRRLRTPSAARVLSTLSAGPVIIMSTPAAIAANQHRARARASAGATIAVLDRGTGDAFLHRALEWLRDAHVTSVLVEGGPTVHAAFWRAGLVDKVELYVASRPVGPDGVPWFDLPDGALAGLLDRTTVPVGEDVLVQGYVHRID